MLPIDVLLAASPPDLQAEGIAADIRASVDMTLVDDRVLQVAEVSPRLKTTSLSTPCLVVVIGRHVDVELLAGGWHTDRANVVIACVDIIDQRVRIDVRDADLDQKSLLNALRGLATRADASTRERIIHFRLRAVTDAPHEGTSEAKPSDSERPLLSAAIHWIHVVLRAAIPGPGTPGSSEVPGVTLTAAALAGAMDARLPPQKPAIPREIIDADAALARALDAADAKSEALAAAKRAFRLTPLEFRILLLALSPELDIRYQRCMSWLLDDFARRSGTLALFAALIGEPADIRRQLAHSGNLARWRVIEEAGGTLRPADEPVRIDPAIAGWLLGELPALDQDPRVRRLLRLAAWSGADLLSEHEVAKRAQSLVDRLQSRGDVQWLVFTGEDVSGWRALLERGADMRHTILIRVDAARLSSLDTAEIEESGVRLGRLRRVTGRPLVVDAWYSDQTPQDDDALRLFLAAIGGTGVRVGVICADAARIVRLLGPSPCAVYDGQSLDQDARVQAFRAAAASLEVTLDEEEAEALAARYVLPIESLEQALQLARGKRLASDDEERRRQRFKSACQDVAAEGVSRLAERIEPAFNLADIVLPPDRSRQLVEIVDSVRLASTVLEGWRFGEQLPYGRGVTALFQGASGTGKTMAANGVARELGIQILRVDLSRIESKYIGDTPKNIDRMFLDAERSGAAILIDEADALLGKRSEVKDAHDRYANIEVAYLLQRMEAFAGLAILTTNMQQNLDPAFIRRLRFIVDFPRPDADAREQIWRRCLPPGTHQLDDAAFRQLARKIDLTGGHIRQISLRAAFVAAAEESKINMEHIAYASQAEFAKLGMPPVELDLSQRLRAA